MYIDNHFVSATDFATTDWTGVAHIGVVEADYDALAELKDDFTDAVWTQVIGADRFNLDLLVSQVQFAYADFAKLEYYFGDYFAAHFFGKSPIVVQLSGTLVDSYPGASKAGLLEVYQNVLRLSAVAQTGIVPVFYLPACAIQGAVASLALTESATLEAVLQFQMSVLVFRLSFANQVNTGLYKTMSIDYATATPLSGLGMAAATDGQQAQTIQDALDAARAQAQAEPSAAAQGANTSGQPTADYEAAQAKLSAAEATQGQYEIQQTLSEARASAAATTDAAAMGVTASAAPAQASPAATTFTPAGQAWQDGTATTTAAAPAEAGFSFATLPDTIKGAYSSARGAVTDAAGTVTSGLSSARASVLSTEKDWVTTGGSYVTTGFTTFREQLASFGQTLHKGAAAGLDATGLSTSPTLSGMVNAPSAAWKGSVANAGVSAVKRMP